MNLKNMTKAEIYDEWLAMRADRDLFREKCRVLEEGVKRRDKTNNDLAKEITRLKGEVDRRTEQHGDLLMEVQAMVPLLVSVLRARRPNLPYEHERIPF